MSALLQQTPRYNVAAFVELIRPYPDEERWELLDGEAVMMAPQSAAHQRIVMNLAVGANTLARRRGCAAYPGLGIVNDRVDNYAPIPDFVIRCGPPLVEGYANDPVLIAEVLSRSTMFNDRGRKLRFYQSITSLETILLVHQSRPEIEIWLRDGSEWRDAVLTGLDALLELPEFDGRLNLRDIYEGVVFSVDGPAA